MMKRLLVLLFLCASMGLQAQFSYDSVKLETIRWSPKPKQVTGINNFTVDLNGSWYFNENPHKNFWKNQKHKDWKKIEVPGEWVMQGYEVAKGMAAGYKRTFVLPQQWKGYRIKLRCEAVYSECEVWINGQKAGSHLGGFTPFELDVTSNLKSGNNVIALSVKSESLADSLSSASQYAVHPLGGISRPIYLMAIPEVNMASFHVSTTFDEKFEDATLHADFTLSNEVAQNKSVELKLALKDINGNPVKIKLNDDLKAKMQANSKKKLSTDIKVKKPSKWDPEHPNLYTLHCSVLVKGKEVAKMVRRFGFRQVDVRGNQVFVNNHPIKLKGVCHHEVHPLRGRSLEGDIWADDVKLFKEGNVNYLRTSHYPPNEKLMEACDELGMFVEEEGPFCWAHNTPLTQENYFRGIIQPLAEMVERDKSHPCIIQWSVANESTMFKEWFKTAADMIKKIDPSRPRVFSQWGSKADDGYLEVDNHHYPGPQGPDKYRNHKRPITFDEYCHLNAYNRFELMTDPGVRDYWGDIFDAMWEKMQVSKGVLGGALWAGIDDSFFLPSGHVVGYGTWGPVDGWRRKKPEFWHMKKVYSPVKIKFVAGEKNQKVKLSIQNRYLFSNLQECDIKWQNGELKGTISPDIEPGKSGEVTLPINVADVTKLTVDVFKDGGVPVDQYALDLSVPQISTPAINKEQFVYSSKKDIRIAKSKSVIVKVNNRDLTIFDADGKQLIDGFPQLMLIGINGGGGTQMTKEVSDYPIYTPVASNRSIKRIELMESKNKVRIVIAETYEEASGTMTIDITSNGDVSVDYNYGMLKNALYRQWGVAFAMEEGFNKLSWKRKGHWSVYPNDHIGRLQGVASLFYNDQRCGLAGPSTKPTWSYNMDQTPYGSNDFRSTKRNVFEAQLSSSNNSIKLISDGTQHIRCWFNHDKVHMLVADYDNPGSEKFIRGFTTHVRMYDVKLIRGQRLKGVVNLHINNH